MSILNRDIQTAIKPLRLIFWGGLIYLFDFSFSQTVNRRGWQFDILNDFVGMMMITWSVLQLGKFVLHERYRIAMRFVTVIAFLLCFETLHDHLIYDTPPFLSFLLSVLGALAMAATVVFCIAMRWLSSEAGLERSETSWKTTTLLFVIIYLIPLGLFYCAAAIAIATGTSFNINLGSASLLLIPVFFIPLVHLFLSTSRMKTNAEATSKRRKTTDG